MKTRLGHYDIVAELGRGGMGVVYKGHESSLNRYVAIKVLADSLAHDEGVKERFLREARSMAALNDPHIIQIYYIGEDQGQPFFVMEFVEGESLGTLLKREHKVAVGPAAKIIYQTALGLATAHDKGVIHRDIKPGNLMVSSRGSIKIADFGIALSNQDMSKKLTSTGEFVGTPGYLSPEVCLGHQVDQRSDIFSLGIVLFEMLAGRMPFTDESPLGLMLEVVRAEIPDVRQLNGEVDEKIAWILSKMIAKEPADRYQSCHELAEDLFAHPLVSKPGPITIVPKVSAAAATMIGQKTPVSGQRPLANTPISIPGVAAANTRITPSAQPIPPAYPADPATAASQSAFERRSVLDRPTDAGGRRTSSVLPLAIAAILVLGLIGGAWALRDKIPG
ncbi:MAG TPA: protein kinase, partial [Dokdonella sp.]|nr:protein kinase [Dokdonella sp.]HQY55496.1 protein kinase [Dokdonella sp.]